MAGLRRSEICELEWREITPIEDGDRDLVIHARHSKNNQEGKTQDFWLLKGECASALHQVRIILVNTKRLILNETDEVMGLNGQNINRRIQAACRAAGLRTKKLTSHSGRIGLASELTQRGAVARYF